MNEETIKHQKVILFDGICNLCNGSVVFVLEREKSPIFQFASIQSDTGKELLQWCGLPKDFNQAVILIDEGKIYLGSTAALKIGQYLKFPWSVFSSIGLLVPMFFRTWLYSQIANTDISGLGKKICVWCQLKD